MSLLCRTLYIRNNTDQTLCVYETVLRDLQKAVERWAGIGSDGAQSMPWPDVKWQSNTKQIHGVEWIAERDLDRRLFTLAIEYETAKYTWSVTIKVGCTQPDVAVLWEEHNLEPVTPHLPFELMPMLLDFLDTPIYRTTFICANEDKLWATKTYRIYKARTFKLVQFIRGVAGERQLPVVLLSPTNPAKKSKFNFSELQRYLKGVAHIMFLDDGELWRKEDLDLPHPCYNGAIRIYLPGYSPEDVDGIHKYWLTDRLGSEQAEAALLEIVQWVIEKSQLRAKNNLTIEDLEHECTAEKKQIIERITEQKIRKQIDIEKSQEQEAVWNDFYAEYQKLIAENESLQQKVRQQEQKIDRLQWQFAQQQWSNETIADEEAAVDATPILMLSQQARAALGTFDTGERSYFEEKVLSKLTVAQHRDSQCEVIKAKNGSCYVFPRKRSAGGRRVIFYLSGREVRVCELFANHNNYDTARDLSIDLTKYDKFAPVDLVLAP